MSEEYHFFWSGPFSQWQYSKFKLDGLDFVCAEQAMMYLKAKLFGDDDTAQAILEAKDPGKQKALGRQVKGFSNAKWDAHKLSIVERVNRAKYSQNKGLRRKLFQTGCKQLVEASPMDTIWGIGLDELNAKQTPPELWPGQNLLGQMLTRLRDELKEEFPDESVAV